MANTLQDVKGRAKEAAGDLTNNTDLKNEGVIDQFVASFKDFIDSIVDMIKRIFGMG